MKRIGKVFLLLIILLAYIGIVCLGVMLVISDSETGSLLPLQPNVVASVTENQKEKFQQVVSSTLSWSEEALVKERQMSEYIEGKLSELTIEQKLAQMMILTNENDITAANLQKYQPGGVIFFEVDFKGKTIENVRNRVDVLQSYSKIPLLVGVDEEGGEVSRLKTLAERDVPNFQGARELYKAGKDAIQTDTMLKMQYLTELGINANFAPVADVVNANSSYMYLRSASGDAKEVGDYVQTVLSVMEESQVVSCIKHFPGYGDNVNTHDSLAKDNRSLSEYEGKDFLPFRTGIKVGVDMVMVSHIIMEEVDDKNPASLSAKVHTMLRDELDFKSVVIADDLNMQAILKTMTIEEATGEAFVAGNDMIFSADFAASMKGAMNAMNEGRLKEAQVDESVRRILRMKIEKGLLMVEE